MSGLVWGLVQNFGVLALASVLFATAYEWWSEMSERWRGLIGGLIFGGFSIVAMIGRPIEWEPGVFLDLRLAPVVLAASFVGRPAAVVTIVLAITCRLSFGGDGALPALFSLVAAGILGIIASCFSPRSLWHLLLVVAGATLPLLSFALLPSELGRAFIAHVAPHLALLNTIACFALRMLLGREVRRIECERELRLQAESDPLTGLANRRAFDRITNDPAFGSVNRSLLLVDLDNLKALNDRHGHQAGDLALRAVADALRRHSGRASVTARVGGDEFAMVLLGATLGQTLELAEQVRQSIPEVTVGVNLRHRPTVSIGGATVSAGQSITDSLGIADKKLYVAKSLGRDCSLIIGNESHRVA